MISIVSRPLRILLGFAVLVLLVVLTGVVLRRVGRMSLFLDARDRLEAGESPEVVLRELASRIDWSPCPDGEARLIAGQVLPRSAPVGSVPEGVPLRAYRVGDWVLLVEDRRPVAIAERLRTGWTLVPHHR